MAYSIWRWGFEGRSETDRGRTKKSGGYSNSLSPGNALPNLPPLSLSVSLSLLLSPGTAGLPAKKWSSGCRSGAPFCECGWVSVRGVCFFLLLRHQRRVSEGERCSPAARPLSSHISFPHPVLSPSMAGDQAPGACPPPPVQPRSGQAVANNGASLPPRLPPRAGASMPGGRKGDDAAVVPGPLPSDLPPDPPRTGTPCGGGAPAPPPRAGTPCGFEDATQTTDVALKWELQGNKKKLVSHFIPSRPAGPATARCCPPSAPSRPAPASPAH